MTRKLIAVLGFGVVFSIGSLAWAWAQPAEGDKQPTPCVVVWRSSGLTLAVVGRNSEANAGLEIAVWDDGTTLFSPDRGRLGQHMVVGKVPVEDVRTMLTAIRTAGFWDERRDYLVPDSSYTTIIASEGGKRIVRQWHAYLLPGFGGNLSDEQYRDFVRAWQRTRGAIESLAPVEIQRLEEAIGDKPGAKPNFRGYDIAKPSDTPWSR